MHEWAGKDDEKLLWLDKAYAPWGPKPRPFPRARIVPLSRRAAFESPVFDRCIDQTDIEASLASLPVCLAGCKQLLCLVGETYVSRLWCVMERFVLRWPPPLTVSGLR